MISTRTTFSILRISSIPSLLAGLALLALAGCASYDVELSRLGAMTESGNSADAISSLKKRGPSGSRDLLYWLELGELLRLDGRIDESQQAWRTADKIVEAWEKSSALDPERLFGKLTSLVVNDELRTYEGHDFEKVMLTTRMALNHLAQGDWDGARVAIKRTHEREALIARVREKEYEALAKETKSKDIRTGYKELGGYPVATLDNPEVNALKNSYQSALSHYLAGFVYEALREPSLAAAGYRQAIELRPGIPLLEQALAGLDARAASDDGGSTDILFVFESGAAPARRSKSFSIYVPEAHGWLWVSYSFPVMESRAQTAVPAPIRLDEIETPVERITSIDAMARRSLAEEMPGIIARAWTRAIVKGAAEHVSNKKNRNDLASLLIGLAGELTENADERAWRSLPAELAFARVRLPHGSHALSLATPQGIRRFMVNASTSHALVSVRQLGSRLVVRAAPGVVTNIAATPAGATIHADRELRLIKEPSS